MTEEAQHNVMWAPERSRGGQAGSAAGRRPGRVTLRRLMEAVSRTDDLRVARLLRVWGRRATACPEWRAEAG